MPGHFAVPILKRSMQDSAEDVRLVSHGMIDQREKEINEDITRFQEVLAGTDDQLFSMKLCTILRCAIGIWCISGLPRERCFVLFTIGLSTMHIGHLKANPSDGEVLMVLGKLRLHQRQPDAAEDCFRKAEELGVPLSRVLLYRAEAAFYRKDFALVRDLLSGRQAFRIPDISCRFLLSGGWAGAHDDLRHADQADICLVLEGTFPYVRGGVSAWVNTMLHALAEYRFAIVYIGSTKADCAVQQYEIPSNVVYFEQIFLHEGMELAEPEAMPGSEQLFDTVADIHAPESRLLKGTTGLFATINDLHVDHGAMAPVSMRSRCWKILFSSTVSGAMSSKRISPERAVVAVHLRPVLALLHRPFLYQLFLDGEEHACPPVASHAHGCFSSAGQTVPCYFNRLCRVFRRICIDSP